MRDFGWPGDLPGFAVFLAGSERCVKKANAPYNSLHLAFECFNPTIVQLALTESLRSVPLHLGIDELIFDEFFLRSQFRPVSQR